MEKLKMVTLSKTQKMTNALNKGSEFSVNQAMSRFGFEHRNSVTGVIYNLRSSGLNIQTVETPKGDFKYRLVTARRSA